VVKGQLTDLSTVTQWTSKHTRFEAIISEAWHCRCCRCRCCRLSRCRYRCRLSWWWWCCRLSRCRYRCRLSWWWWWRWWWRWCCYLWLCSDCRLPSCSASERRWHHDRTCVAREGIIDSIYCLEVVIAATMHVGCIESHTRVAIFSGELVPHAECMTELVDRLAEIHALVSIQMNVGTRKILAHFRPTSSGNFNHLRLAIVINPIPIQMPCAMLFNFGYILRHDVTITHRHISHNGR